MIGIADVIRTRKGKKEHLDAYGVCTVDDDVES
jgi:hypothetical protein